MLGTAVGVLLACAAMASPAKAESIVVMNAAIASDGSGGALYTYTAELTFGNQVQDGDFFTIYDFQGLLGITSQVSGANVIAAGGTWTFSSTTTGPTPSMLPASGVAGAPGPLGDRADLPNITFTYHGATVTGTSPFPPLTLLLTFTAHTTVFPGNQGDSFVAQDHSPIDGTAQSNFGSVLVPFDVNGPTITPVPGSAYAGMGLMGLLGLGRVIRRRSSAA